MMKVNDPIQTDIKKILPSPFQNQKTLKKANQENINSFNTFNKKSAENNRQQEKELMLMITQIIKTLIELLNPETKKTNTTNNNKPAVGNPASIGGSRPVKTTNISPSPSGPPKTTTNSKIPEATENIQNFQLGDKNISVGSDATASATEVEETAKSIKHAYQNSPTFQNMIDQSSDPFFTVTVGKRNDNTSWGNTAGKIFMNLNNIQASNDDAFQALLAHEFAHASIDLKHGAEIQRIEKAVAKEA